MTLSLTFNPAVLSYESYLLGRDIGSGASAIVNTSRVSRGQAGFGLLLKPGESFLAGELEILVVRFKVLNQGAGATNIGSGPVSLGLSDADAQTLPVRPVFGKKRASQRFPSGILIREIELLVHLHQLSASVPLCAQHTAPQILNTTI